MSTTIYLLQSDRCPCSSYALDRVHSVENKMLEYLSNAQGAMQNLYQIKRAGELVTVEIPKNCSLLTKSVGRNLKGTAIAAIVSDELTDAATQMAALYPFMKQLVQRCHVSNNLRHLRSCCLN